MRHAFRLIAAICCALASLHVGPVEAKRVALVIGNASYKVGPLQNPVNDATAVAEAFGRLGFDKVMLKRDLTLEGFRAALLEMSRESAGAELGVIYFAGHGTEVNRRNFLIPVDANLARAGDLDLEAIALETVLNQLAGVLKLKLVILDACRNNLFPLAGAQRSVSRGLTRIEPEDNTLVAYAAKDGTIADDGAGRRHSPFTEALLNHIAKPGLEIRQLFGYVRDEVMVTTNRQQQPYLYGTLGGPGFYLQPSDTPAASAPAPTVHPQLNDAERAWAAAKDSTSVAVMEAFRRQYGAANAFYDQLAEARIEELKKQQIAVAAPQPSSASPLFAQPSSPSPALTRPSVQGYPTRQIALVVPFAPGDPTDVAARLVGEQMGRTLGQRIQIENIASRDIGAGRVATSEPDGYSILIHSSALAAAPSLRTGLQFDPRTAFEPVGLVGYSPMVLMSKKDVKARNLKELMEWMRVNAGRISVVHTGVGSISHACSLLIEQVIGQKFILIPFRGSGRSLDELASGGVDVMCDVSGVAESRIIEGKVKGYAVLDASRLSAIKDVPTSTEGGVPNLQLALYNGLYAPRGTPREIVNTLNAALQRALADKELVNRLAGAHVVVFDASMRSPEAHAKYFAADMARQAQLFRAGNVTPQ
jgi:tripartite-type tricarboxylate transporter receptor subunit TctC/uncharacterized caspase-like protein